MKVFNINVNHQKDPVQRMACGCVVSRDIGMYDSCPFNCAYCYATSSIARVLLGLAERGHRRALKRNIQQVAVRRIGFANLRPLRVDHHPHQPPVASLFLRLRDGEHLGYGRWCP